VNVLDAADGSVVTRFTAHRGAVISADFKAARGLIVTRDTDGAACVWDAATGAQLWSFRDREGELRAAAADPAASAAGDRQPLAADALGVLQRCRQIERLRRAGGGEVAERELDALLAARAEAPKVAPGALSTAALRLVCRPGCDLAAAVRACQWADHARKISPVDGLIYSAYAWGLYRLGRHEAARATQRVAAPLNLVRFRRVHPCDLALEALFEHRSGQETAARTTLAKMRAALAEQVDWALAYNPLLEEVEAVVASGARAPPPTEGFDRFEEPPAGEGSGEGL
jgi:hypothetical protein